MRESRNIHEAWKSCFGIRGFSMWTVVYVSRNKDKIDKLISILNSSSIITMLRLNGNKDSENSVTYEILVPRTELDQAQDIIFDTELSVK